MDAALYKALSGSIAQMRRLDVAVQDLSNVNTSGYKGERLAFSEFLAAPGEERERMGGLVTVGKQLTAFSQGQLQQTGNPLDLAIDGEGFFVVETPQGVRYTRQSTFSLSADGTVVTTSGYPLLGEGGPIRITGKEIKVTPDGRVSTEDGEGDQIRVVRFAEANQLIKEGASLFKAPDSLVEEVPAEYSVLQGNVEQANVSPVQAMVALITIQRQFETYERAMKMMDSATERILAEATR